MEHRPQALRLNAWQLKSEAGMSEDPVSLRGLVNNTEWGVYPTVAEIDQLLTYLNPRGEILPLKGMAGGG